jgi:predicted metal-dependent hydrolase
MRKDARRHGFLPTDPLPQPIEAEVFKDEVRAWAQRLDVQPAEVHITGMRRKWASCSSRGRVTFDADLLAQPEPFRREVIVHELLHLKVANHGPLFRALLRTHLETDPA